MRLRERIIAYSKANKIPLSSLGELFKVKSKQQFHAWITQKDTGQIWEQIEEQFRKIETPEAHAAAVNRETQEINDLIQSLEKRKRFLEGFTDDDIE